MKILLTGATGGIGSAIKEALIGHEFVEASEEIDWIIFAHGVLNEGDLDQTFGVNTLDCISDTQLLLPYLKKGIIYISSTAAFKGNDKFPIYAASKAALNNYTLSMAKKHPELQFYAVCPGPTDTKFWRSLGLEGKAQSPSAVADVVMDCIEGKYKSGDIISVRDGKVTV